MKFVLRVAFSIIALGLFVAFLVFYITWISNVQTLEGQAKEDMEDLAFHVMNKIDRFFFYRSADLRIIANDPVITSPTSSPQERTKRLCEYRDTYKAYISLSFFDVHKVRVADTSGLGIGREGSSYKYWNDVLQGKLILSADVGISDTLGVPVIFFASLVKDTDNVPIGVVIIRLSIDKLYEIVGAFSTRAAVQEHIQVDLVDQQGLLLYSNHNREGILKENLENWEATKRSFAGEKQGSVKNHIHHGQEFISVFCTQKGYLDFPGNGWILILHIPTKIILEPIIELRKKWFSVIAPGLLLVFFSTFLFAFRASQPLKELRRAALDLGSGKLNARVSIHSNDELEDLGAVFNEMAEAIQKTDSELLASKEYAENFSKTLEQKVEDRTMDLLLYQEKIKKLNENLQVQAERLERINRELEKSNRIKTEFMSIVSHELRTPLCIMKEGLSQVMEGLHGELQSIQKELLSISFNNILRLEKIINGLLDLTKIEAGQLELRPISFNLVSLVREIGSNFKLLAQNKGIILNQIFQKEIMNVFADRDTIVQVLTNLLNNALKFTEKGFISLSVCEKEGVVECSIADSGIGIAQKDIPRVFGKFQQLGTSLRSSEKGTGLGLSICKTLLEIQKGSIRFESELGKGSTFTFTLPSG